MPTHAPNFSPVFPFPRPSNVVEQRTLLRDAAQLADRREVIMSMSEYRTLPSVRTKIGRCSDEFRLFP